MKKAFKYRFYPTDEQKILLAQTFGCVRFVYNEILRWRTDLYYEHKEKIDYDDACKKLTKLKKNPELQFLNEVSSVALQQSLRNQQAAFKNFFEGRAKYPTFKKKNAKQSFRLTSVGFSYKNSELFIAKSKQSLQIRWDKRTLPSYPSSISISKDSAGRYFVSLLCEFIPKKKLSAKKSIGLDLGLTHLAITDTGEKFNNPRHTRKYAEKLAKYQRRLSKKKLGSSNRNRARHKVAKVHAKIADCRVNSLHKISSRLINENQVVCVESLRVKNMIKNPKLSKSIADAGWGELVRQLEYKAEWKGRKVIKIDQWFPSSKRCSSCGFIKNKLPLDIRSWECPECRSHHDRDVNAAKNVKAVGLAVLAFGEDVRGTDLVSAVRSSMN